MLKALQMPDAKAAMEKRKAQLVKIRHGSWQKSESKKRWSKKQGIRTEKFISRHWWIFVISRIRSWNLGIKSTKAESYSEVTLWKVIHDRMQYLLSKNHQHHRWQPQSHGDYFQTTRMRRTSSRRSICLYPGKNGRCSKIIENSKIGMSRHLDTPTEAQMAQIMVQYGRPSCSSWAESVRSSFGRTVMGKAIWENPIEIRLGTPWKRTILICVCGRYQTGWKETKHWSDVENPHERRKFERNNIPCFYRLHSKRMSDKQGYCGQLQNHVWIANSAGGTEKLPYSENLRISSWSYDMAGHAKKCVERIVSWRTRRLSNSTKYLLHASMTIISKKKNENLLENCHKYAPKLFWNAYTWHVLDDLIFYGQWTNLDDQSQNWPKLVTNA